MLVYKLYDLQWNFIRYYEGFTESQVIVDVEWDGYTEYILVLQREKEV